MVLGSLQSGLLTSNIAYLELFAVYVALITWGNKLYDQHIFSDNEATVHV